MADDFTLGDVVRLIDGLAKSTQESLIKIETEMTGLRTEMRTGFGTLRTEMHEGFDRVERRLGHLETRVENVEERVGVLEARQ